MASAAKRKEAQEFRALEEARESVLAKVAPDQARQLRAEDVLKNARESCSRAVSAMYERKLLRDSFHHNTSAVRAQFGGPAYGGGGGGAGVYGGGHATTDDLGDSAGVFGCGSSTGAALRAVERTRMQAAAAAELNLAGSEGREGTGAAVWSQSAGAVNGGIGVSPSGSSYTSGSGVMSHGAHQHQHQQPSPLLSTTHGGGGAAGTADGAAGTSYPGLRTLFPMADGAYDGVPDIRYGTARRGEDEAGSANRIHYGDQQQYFGHELLDSDDWAAAPAAPTLVPPEPGRDPWHGLTAAEDAQAAPFAAAGALGTGTFHEPSGGAQQRFQPRAASTPPEHLNPSVVHGASSAASARRVAQTSAWSGASRSPQRRCLTPTPASPPRHHAQPQPDANAAAAAISKLLHTEEIIDHHAAILDRNFSPGLLTRERELGNRLGWQAASGVLGRARLMHSKGAVPSNLALKRMAAAVQGGGRGASGAGGAPGASTWMEQQGHGRAEHGSAEWVARAAVLTTQARPRASATAKAAAAVAGDRDGEGEGGSGGGSSDDDTVELSVEDAGAPWEATACAGANNSSSGAQSAFGCGSPSLLRPSGTGSLHPSLSNSHRQPPAVSMFSLPAGSAAAASLGERAASPCQHCELSPLSASRLVPTGAGSATACMASMPRRDMFASMAAAASASASAASRDSGVADDCGRAVYTVGGGDGDGSNSNRVELVAAAAHANAGSGSGGATGIQAVVSQPSHCSDAAGEASARGRRRAQVGARQGGSAPAAEDGKGVMARLFKAFNHLRKVEAAAHDM
eukprot:XP_001696130.1 predicted protein [Chlamydomonas reinhardtii]